MPRRDHITTAPDFLLCVALKTGHAVRCAPINARKSARSGSCGIDSLRPDPICSIRRAIPGPQALAMFSGVSCGSSSSFAQQVFRGYLPASPAQRAEVSGQLLQVSLDRLLHRSYASAVLSAENRQILIKCTGRG